MARVRETQTAVQRKRFVPAKHIRVTTSPEGGTVLDLHAGRCYHLNAVACLIWQELLAGEPIFEIAQIVAGRCSCDPSRVQADLDSFLRSLVDRKWIIEAGQQRCPGLARFLKDLMRHKAAHTKA